MLLSLLLLLLLVMHAISTQWQQKLQARCNRLLMGGGHTIERVNREGGGSSEEGGRPSGGRRESGRGYCQAPEGGRSSDVTSLQSCAWIER